MKLRCFRLLQKRNRSRYVLSSDDDETWDPRSTSLCGGTKTHKLKMQTELELRQDDTGTVLYRYRYININIVPVGFSERIERKHSCFFLSVFLELKI